MSPNTAAAAPARNPDYDALTAVCSPDAIRRHLARVPTRDPLLVANVLTTAAVLTGQLSPTAGRAVIYGNNTSRKIRLDEVLHGSFSRTANDPTVLDACGGGQSPTLPTGDSAFDRLVDALVERVCNRQQPRP